jgi:glycosyltransferase involved in cell wall biosynthesis
MTSMSVRDAITQTRVTSSRAERVFRLLFIGKNHLPSTVGGAELSTHFLVAALEDRGHDVTLVAQLPRRTAVGLVDTARATVTSRVPWHVERSLGYETVRSTRPLSGVEDLVLAMDPDVAVVMGTNPMFAVEALRAVAAVPTVLYVRVDAGVDVAAGPEHKDVVVANSRFMETWIRDRGQDAVFIPSMFPRSVYDVATSRTKVLFVNPIAKKGVSIALALAERRPDIPFVFALSWRMRSDTLRSLKRRARRLGNVEIRAATLSPRDLFHDARVLLVPSQGPEAWARVVSEAHISGIPVIASRLGGLEQSVGDGGLLVSPKDSVDAWLEALSSVWDHPSTYDVLAERARAYSRRPELSIDVVAERFEGILIEAIERHAAHGG